MVQIVRRLEFDAGHRVLNHEGKCRNLHGHRYVVDVALSSLGLDDLGRVVDFGVVKQVLGKWIDDELDHNMILNPGDPLLCLDDPDIDYLNVVGQVGREPFVMPETHPNPTAENIARVIYDKAVELLNSGGLSVESVTVWETPNCNATYP